MRLLALIILSIILSSHAKAIDNESRIIGGQRAKRGELPYMVALTVEFQGQKGFGGGSLIRTNYVLTAASIFRGRTDTPAIALLGVTDLFDLNGIEIRSKSVSIHPQYDPINKHNDIALVELRQHVQLNEFIKTVALPMRSDVGRSFNNFPVIKAGWGILNETANEPIPNRHLHLMRSTVISHLSCSIRYPAFMTENKICINANSDIGSPCTGDEGGPLVVDTQNDNLRIQLGIFTYQFTLGCQRGWPAVHTRTSRYLDWIAQITGLNLP